MATISLTIKHGGTFYQTSRKKGKVTVRAEGTARGQNLIRGIYDLRTCEWQNEDALPNFVKQEVIDHYSDDD